MPTYQTTGIIIGRTNFGEADRVIRFLTPDHGKISAVAKGVRKIKSRAAGHLEPLGEAKLMLAVGRNLDIVTNARLIWYPHQLVGDYPRLSLGLVIASIIDRYAAERTPHPDLYQHLGQTLKALDENAPAVLVELWFKLRFLQLAGLRPELSRCLNCGQDQPDITYHFDAERGGLTCDTCTSSGTPPISTTTIKFWRLLSDYPYTTISQISDAQHLATASLEICNTFYKYHLGPHQ